MQIDANLIIIISGVMHVCTAVIFLILASHPLNKVVDS